MNLTRTQADREWQTLAACRGANPELFFPDKRYGTRQIVRRAIENTRREYCNQCPVIERCREYAKAYHTRDGIWGGRFLGGLK